MLAIQPVRDRDTTWLANVHDSRRVVAAAGEAGVPAVGRRRFRRATVSEARGASKVAVEPVLDADVLGEPLDLLDGFHDGAGDPTAPLRP